MADVPTEPVTGTVVDGCTEADAPVAAACSAGVVALMVVAGGLVVLVAGGEVQVPATLRVAGSEITKCIVVTVAGSIPLAWIKSITAAVSSFSGLPRSTNR